MAQTTGDGTSLQAAQIGEGQPPARCFTQLL